MIAGVVLMEAFGAAIFYGYEASYQEYQKISENFITGGGRLGAFVGQPNWNAAVIAMALPFAFYLRARGQLSLISVYVTGAVRSEERRGGKEGDSTCRCRWAP